MYDHKYIPVNIHVYKITLLVLSRTLQTSNIKTVYKYTTIFIFNTILIFILRFKHSAPIQITCISFMIKK